jgi:hypothetical protein
MFQLNSDLVLCLKMEDFPKSDEREFLAKANVLLEDPDVSISVSSSNLLSLISQSDELSIGPGACPRLHPFPCSSNELLLYSTCSCFS